jgi:uncharacterized protein (TIGR00255 family)
MTVSMTGFASGRGEGVGHLWSIDLRSVNGKGLDLRLRVPDWIDGLEAAVRAAISARVLRGNISLNIKASRSESALAEGGFRIDPSALGAALQVIAVVDAEAMARGVTLAPGTPLDVLSMRGVISQAADEAEDHTALRAAILADLAPVIEAFVAMRQAEGKQLAGVIAGQLAQIAALIEQARGEAAARRETASATLREAMVRVLSAVDQPLDEARIAQEIALLAVKNDVTEEIDRLRAHVSAARGMIAGADAVGRKMDFLTQEFMREANTLCSKSQSLGLTRIGLDLKTLIDQMREQVQNVE